MTENKNSALTDAEIIKALKGCGCTPNCNWCPYYDKEKQHKEKCYIRRNRDFTDLINRQQAEIERLKFITTSNPYCVSIGTADIFTENHEEYEWLLAKISAEAIKEFAERLKNDVDDLPYNWIAITQTALYNIVDNLVKEMAGE